MGDPRIWWVALIAGYHVDYDTDPIPPGTHGHLCAYSGASSKQMEGETMNDCILALNAGSSSIKCSLFATERRSDTLSLVYQGGFEGIGSEPRLLVYSPTGQSLVDRQFSTILSIDEAMSILLEWIEGHEEGVTLRGSATESFTAGRCFQRQCS
jgi:hypothetical protein